MSDARTSVTRDARLLRAVRMTVAATVVVLAAFFPWNGVSPGREVFGAVGAGLSFAQNGWEGGVPIGGILFPHWIVVPLALLLAVVGWFEWLTRRNAPLRFTVPIALIGLLYPVWVFYDVSRQRMSFVGVGVPITILAFLYLLWACVRRPRPQGPGGSAAMPAEQADEGAQGGGARGVEGGSPAEAEQASDR